MPSIVNVLVVIGVPPLKVYPPWVLALTSQTTYSCHTWRPVHVATASLESLTEFLRVRGWIPPAASVVARARLGGGRTATTIRLTTDAGAIRILRQPGTARRDDARHVASPSDRLAVEGEFYRLIQPYDAVAERMPACLGVDRTDHVIALEDLGPAGPLTDLY